MPFQRILLADPPWSYRDPLAMDDIKRAASNHYPTLTVDEICAYLPSHPFWALFGYDSILFLCVTNPFLLDGSGTRVCRAWGYEPKQLITWVKGREDTEGQLVLRAGLGKYTRGCTEHVILATRGQATRLVKDHTVRNYLEVSGGFAFLDAPTTHSTKPEELYQLIERLVVGPYCEIFARRRRPDWVQDGNQLPPARFSARILEA